MLPSSVISCNVWIPLTRLIWRIDTIAPISPHQPSYQIIFTVCLLVLITLSLTLQHQPIHRVPSSPWCHSCMPKIWPRNLHLHPFQGPSATVQHTPGHRSHLLLALFNYAVKDWAKGKVRWAKMVFLWQHTRKSGQKLVTGLTSASILGSSVTVQHGLSHQSHLL